ncbi:MAG: hypothetical protein LPK19_01090, partial [Hymenobacteraceae bacterium]|nr:hypothetical protein [Hymenobacteraceae bacterium]MDX5394767.1 hypothetical protein [Hymenobacteraceae bacterium]MDX5510798.1 hypothetical protein [Hymenobacteraceae bacterium]
MMQGKQAEGIKSDRVREATPQNQLIMIDEQLKQHLLYYEGKSPNTIKMRLMELEREWDVERVLELNASALGMAGLILGIKKDKKWLGLTGMVLTFLMQHAVQGWCPPVPLFRALNIRTRKEIDLEKYALKVLRGDYARVAEKPTAAGAWDA